jgi:hypothetical protein
MNFTVNGLNLSDGINYLIEEADYRGTPDRRTYSSGISRRPGDKLTGQEWGTKKIKIKGRVWDTNYSNLLTRVDTLQKTIAPQSSTITVDTGRSYIGTLTQLQIPNQFYNMSMIQYDAEFLCLDPFSYGSQLTVSGMVVSGTLTYSGTLTISGSVFAEPVLTLNPTGSTEGNSGLKSISIANTTAGENLTVSGMINYTADLQVDYSAYQVTNSGVLSDFQGIYSRFEPGANNFEITVVSGTRQGYLWKFSYSPRYYQ